MVQVHDEASKVRMTEGTVTVDGPGGTAMTLTPEAAAETADRLLECADEAFIERGATDQATTGAHRERHADRAVARKE